MRQREWIPVAEVAAFLAANPEWFVPEWDAWYQIIDPMHDRARWTLVVRDVEL